MKTLTIALAGLLLCGACDDKEYPDTYPTYAKSYIFGFFDIDALSVLERIKFSVDNNRIISQHNLDNIVQGRTYRIDAGIVLQGDIYSEWITDDYHSDRYEALCRELGDTLFKKTFSIFTSLNRPSALTGMIDKLHIIANEDYSADYPAGADASGLFTLFYENPHAVVLNNYQSPPNAYRLEYTSIELPQAFYKVPLAEADLKGKKALGVQFYLLLNSAPDRSGSYTFTIEVKASDGKILTATTKPISIQAEP